MLVHISSSESARFQTMTSMTPKSEDIRQQSPSLMYKWAVLGLQLHCRVCCPTFFLSLPSEDHPCTVAAHHQPVGQGRVLTVMVHPRRCNMRNPLPSHHNDHVSQFG